MQILEKELEDWAAENLNTITGRPECFLVGRQVRLPTGGVLDLLAARHGPDITFLYVIELKRAVVDAAAVIQVLGYLAALDFLEPHLNIRENREVSILGILMAQSLTTEAALAIQASSRLTFTKVDVAIAAENWRSVPVATLQTEQAERFAESLAEFVSSHLLSEPVPGNSEPESLFESWDYEEVDSAVDSVFKVRTEEDR